MQCKKSVYVGKEEVWREELADLETGLQADRICTREQKVQREGLRV
jgi:hypothetical protein